MKFYKPKKSLCGEVIARHLGVRAVIAINDDEKWVSIYLIESENSDRGEAQEFVRELRRSMPDYKIYSSIPVSPKWLHICRKLSINY